MSDFKKIQLYRNAALFSSEQNAVDKLTDATFSAGMLDGTIAATRYQEGTNPIKTVFAIYHRGSSGIVTPTVFNPESVPADVQDMFNKITINGVKLFDSTASPAIDGTITLDGEDIKVGGESSYKDNTIADAITAINTAITNASSNIAFNVVKLATPSSGATASYQLQKSGTNDPIGATIDVPADRILKSASIGDSADTFNTADGTITSATTASGEEVLHMVFQLANGTFELADISLENLVFEAEAGDGLQVDTEGGHKLSVKIDGTTETYITVSENGLKISGLDTQFEVIAASLNDLDGRVLTNAQKIADNYTSLNQAISTVSSNMISVQGTTQQIKITDGTGTAKVIGFADDAIFDCGEF